MPVCAGVYCGAVQFRIALQDVHVFRGWVWVDDYWRKRGLRVWRLFIGVSYWEGMINNNNNNNITTVLVDLQYRGLNYMLW